MAMLQLVLQVTALHARVLGESVPPISFQEPAFWAQMDSLLVMHASRVTVDGDAMFAQMVTVVTQR